MLALELKKKKCLLLNRLVSSYEKESLILSSLRFFTKKNTCQLDREAFNWSRIKTQTCKKVLCIYCATLKSWATLQDFSFPNGGAFPLPKDFRLMLHTNIYIWPICTWIKPFIVSSSWWAYNDVRQSFKIYPLKLIV